MEKKATNCALIGDVMMFVYFLYLFINLYSIDLMINIASALSTSSKMHQLPPFESEIN